jgi:hypothetical protein
MGDDPVWGPGSRLAVKLLVFRVHQRQQVRAHLEADPHRSFTVAQAARQISLNRDPDRFEVTRPPKVPQREQNTLVNSSERSKDCDDFL